MQSGTEISLIRCALENLERAVVASGDDAPITRKILKAFPRGRRAAALEDLKDALTDAADRAEYLAEL